MEWPACSPDLNPIENVWGWMVRKLYAKGKNYGSKNDLKKSIIELWGKIPGDLIERLALSMKKDVSKFVVSRDRK